MASKQDKLEPKKTTTRAKAPAKKVPRTAAARRAQRVSHDAIAKRAYELYLVQGGGDEVAHWLHAERELAAS